MVLFCGEVCGFADLISVLDYLGVPGDPFVLAVGCGYYVGLLCTLLSLEFDVGCCLGRLWSLLLWNVLLCGLAVWGVG